MEPPRSMTPSSTPNATPDATGTTCAAHPQAAAAYRCDGCGQLLCHECVQTGHRLLFCRLCGERALPLAGTAAPATTAAGTITGRRRERIVRSAAAYSLGDAMAYPLRGDSRGVFLVFVAVLLGLGLVRMLPFSSMAALLLSLVVWLLVPRFLFTIANRTAQGDDELPTWPDFDLWELVRTALLFGVTSLLSLLPAILLVRLGGFTLGGLLTGGDSLVRFLMVLAVGLLLSMALWVPAFGAVALYDTFLAALRLDLHVRALLVSPAEVAATTGMLAALLVVGTFLRLLLAGVPLLGGVLATAVLVYTLFTGAHLVGVYFRRHWDALEAVYLG